MALPWSPLPRGVLNLQGCHIPRAVRYEVDQVERRCSIIIPKIAASVNLPSYVTTSPRARLIVSRCPDRSSRKYVAFGAENSYIGYGNTIAYNEGDGVRVDGATTSRNTFTICAPLGVS